MIGSGTIAAVASPPGRAPRAAVRCSGPATGDVLRELCGVERLERGVRRAELILGARRLPALVLMTPGPRSYTGEDAAEIHLCGNPSLVASVMDRACAVEGVRPAGPGEFSLRAFLSGRLTLDQAEGVVSLIEARSAEEAADAQRLLKGEAGAQARGWAEELARLLALVEAGVDFIEAEDVVPIPRDELLVALDRVREELAAGLGGSAKELPAEGPLVVLAGAPNAGKTTLLNALLVRERGVVSETAGSTRDVIEEPFTLRGVPARLADVAGLSAGAAGGLDEIAQRRARATIEEADVIVHCDPAGVFDPLPGVAGELVRVRTKADRPGETPGGALAVCALDGWNIGALRERLASAALGARDLTPRWRRACEGASAALDDAIGRVQASGTRAVEDPELVAEALRDALAALADLAGETPADEIIGRVFASFCVGK